MKRVERFYFPFFMAAFMTAIMSFVLTAIHQGFHPEFLINWGKGFSLAFPIAFLSVIFVAPFVMKLSESLKRKDSDELDNSVIQTSTPAASLRD